MTLPPAELGRCQEQRMRIANRLLTRFLSRFQCHPRAVDDLSRADWRRRIAWVWSHFAAPIWTA